MNDTFLYIASRGNELKIMLYCLISFAAILSIGFIIILASVKPEAYTKKIPIVTGIIICSLYVFTALLPNKESIDIIKKNAVESEHGNK
ncbi:MAG: hypothetical protein PHE93_06485 [Clostridia bacterium]|nr:hypothetical protein [Clostridia bacterium]